MPSHATIIKADARSLPLSDESVDCCVTSPPYWGLRDYGGCDCGTKRYRDSQGENTGGDMNYRVGAAVPSCPKCDGTGRLAHADQQLGLERTPEEYVASMVQVFREVRRVLKPLGTLWLNLGDCYATGAGSYRNPGSDVKPIDHGGKQAYTRDYARAQPNRMPIDGLKPKDLVGIPWRVAFALQADGWWLRSDIIWSKPNPMPESVTDRPTKAHEYVFLLAKSERYWYDIEAVREDPKPWNDGIMRAPKCGPDRPGYNSLADDSGNVTVKQYDEIKGANRRTVWTIATQPYSGAHFATFPEELARLCILAGCPRGGTVLDPFAGSGTVGQVAVMEGRSAILCDIAYQDLQHERTAQVGLF